jgi:hypothetical protein
MWFLALREYHKLGFKIIRVLNMKIVVPLGMTYCSLVVRYQLQRIVAAGPS